MKPMLFLGGLSRRVFVTTRYKQTGVGDDGRALFIAHTKEDVTEDFYRVLGDMRRIIRGSTEDLGIGAHLPAENLFEIIASLRADAADLLESAACGRHHGIASDLEAIARQLETEATR